MGADMTEGTVVKWLKEEGDSVARGDKLAEIETDKTVVEMESYSNGLLRKIVVGEGIKVNVGELIAYIGDAGDELPFIAGEAEADEPEPEMVAEPEVVEAPPPAPAPVPAAVPALVPGGRIKASPMARRLARERGIDIALVPGTGPGGRITRDDVLSWTPPPVEKVAEEVPAEEEVVEAPVAEVAEEAPVAEVAEEEPAEEAVEEAPAEEVAEEALSEEAPATSVAPALSGLIDASDELLTSMRQAIARVTVRSKTEKPHFYVTVSVDATEMMNLRASVNEALDGTGTRISVNDVIIKACVNALQAHPKFNKYFEDDRLVGQSGVNVGIAISLESGLIVPALLNCEGMSLSQISQAAKDLGRRARGDGSPLTQEEMTGGTFAISNMGMLDVESFSAIIVPPQTAILAVGSVVKTPVVRDGEIVVADIMKATLSVDHRVADGAEGAVFLNEIRKNLENPLRLLV